MIRQLQPQDLKNFIYFCQNKDADFYMTKDKNRLFLTDTKNAKQAFNDCLKHGDKCYIKEENNQILAIMLVLGFKDKFQRKYIKILSQRKKDFEDLFSYLQWQGLDNLFIKVKNTNTNFVKFDKTINRYKPSYILRKNGFGIIAVRDREVLLKFQGQKRLYTKIYIKEDD